jgi:hypothetical protein
MLHARHAHVIIAVAPGRFAKDVGDQLLAREKLNPRFSRITSKTINN